MDGLIDYFLEPEQGLASATDLLFGGCSAGGLTSYVHADYVANRMPSTVKTLAVADVCVSSLPPFCFFHSFLYFFFNCETCCCWMRRRMNAMGSFRIKSVLVHCLLQKINIYIYIVVSMKGVHVNTFSLLLQLCDASLMTLTHHPPHHHHHRMKGHVCSEFKHIPQRV